MRLEQATNTLGWPSPQDIFKPSGSGPAVFTAKASQKMEVPFQRTFPNCRFRLGLLHRDANSPSSQAPIAIVCDFENLAKPEELRELHRLSWNFCHAPVLIVLEPSLIRVWDCATQPIAASNDTLFSGPEAPASILSIETKDETLQALRLLSWISLASGVFFREHLPPEKYRVTSRADRSLLSNLKSVRQELKDLKLEVDTCHDLLARVIFIQFLFDRKDSEGKSALNEAILKRWNKEGLLSKVHSNFGSILRSKKDTYALFRKLNAVFNGDLFPGKEAPSDEHTEQAWKDEMAKIKPSHLKLLSSLVSGDADVKTGQYWLWKEYSFDTIPLEFISSIYEEFVARDQSDRKNSPGKIEKKASKQGVVFTPGLLADFVLDKVLPWRGSVWDLTVLDPSCGSGMFLVKAYQRLVHRWREAYPEKQPTPTVLRRLLEKNIYGVDKDPHAVRVASFSLYLAMMDELDPRDYLKRDHVKFPLLRQRRIIRADFFDPDWRDRWSESKLRFDIIIGNAPWGQNTITQEGRDWAANNKWDVANGDTGPLFLPASETLLKEGGRLSLLQPAMGLLFNRSELVSRFRERFFGSYNVEQIVNFAPVRFSLFGGDNKAISPTCLVVLQSGVFADHDNPLPDDSFQYASVKPRNSGEDACHLAIDSLDIHRVVRREAAFDPLIWPCLCWGGRRDLALLRHLQSFDNLKTLKEAGILYHGDGIEWEGVKKTKRDWLFGRKRIDSADDLEGVYSLQASALTDNHDIEARRAESARLFAAPQIIIRKSWTVGSGRINAVKIEPEYEGLGVLCSKRFISVALSDPNSAYELERIWLTFNSKLAVFHQMLSSGRLSSFTPELLPKDIARIPIPEAAVNYGEAGVFDLELCDNYVKNAFGLSESQWVLVEDLFDYTLPDFKQGSNSPGRRVLNRDDESELKTYFKYFSQVIRGTFGEDKRMSCKVWQEVDHKQLLGFRFITITLGAPKHEDQIEIHVDEQGTLLDQVSAEIEAQRSRQGPIGIESTLRLYSSHQSGDDASVRITFIKPDQIRYWTRSMAMRDADEVVADIMMSKLP